MSHSTQLPSGATIHYNSGFDSDLNLSVDGGGEVVSVEYPLTVNHGAWTSVEIKGLPLSDLKWFVLNVMTEPVEEQVADSRSESLAPCPIPACGSSIVEIAVLDREVVVVQCSRCNMCGPWADTEKAAIQNWKKLPRPSVKTDIDESVYSYPAIEAGLVKQMKVNSAKEIVAGSLFLAWLRQQWDRSTNDTNMTGDSMDIKITPQISCAWAWLATGLGESIAGAKGMVERGEVKFRHALYCIAKGGEK